MSNTIKTIGLCLEVTMILSIAGLMCALVGSILVMGVH